MTVSTIRCLMFPKLFFVSLLTTVLVACASNPSAEQAVADVADAESAKPKMRCHREANTGFRLGNGRICKPVAD